MVACDAASVPPVRDAWLTWSGPDSPPTTFSVNVNGPGAEPVTVAAERPGRSRTAVWTVAAEAL
jgi:hypothetical protein